MKRANPEQALHRACAQLLDLYQERGGYFWTTVGHGGGGRARGAILKGMGVKPGVPDILIFRPGFTGWLELKSAKGRLSPEQSAFRQFVAKTEHCWALVRDVEYLDYLIGMWGLKESREPSRGAAAKPPALTR